MKKNISVLIIIFSITGLIQKTFAQGRAKGLYLTYADYLNNNLSHTGENKSKVYLNSFLEGKTITVVEDGKKITYAKNELFGYRDAENHDYRFSDNKPYEIVDTTRFYLYRRNESLHEGKSGRILNVYYFSLKPNSQLIELSGYNLAKAFPQNRKFKYTVEAAFKSDHNLAEYDEDYKAYKIKELYAQSIK